MSMFAKLTCYPGQPEEEITQFVIFKSIFALLPFLIAAIIIGAVSLFTIYFGSSGQTIQDVPITSSIFTLIGTVLFFANALFVAAATWVWRHNRMVVTNEHVVDVDQLGLFSNRISTLSLGVIQDVSSSINGPLQTIFQYGKLIIQTAGERENFLFDYIPNPHSVEQRILDIHEKFYHHRDRRADGLGNLNAEQETHETEPDQPADNPLNNA